METLVSVDNHDDIEQDISNRTSSAIKWLRLIGINLLAFGLELCASAGFCYIAPIMLKKGFLETEVTFIVGIGPMISLFLLPSIAHWSDRCNSQFGRRRPFMFVLGLLILLSLFIIPYSHEISLLSDVITDNFILAIGVILLDFSTQALMNPCKALIPDLYHTTEEQDSGLTVYSCMLSLGGGIGYLISCINWDNTTLGLSIGGQEKAVFFVMIVCFSLLLVMNLSLAKEVPLYSIHQPMNGHASSEIAYHQKSNVREVSSCGIPFSRRFMLIPKCFIWLRLQRFFHSIAKMLCVCASIPCEMLLTAKLNFLYFWQMPSVMKYLFLSCLFGWMGMMCHDSYYTDFVGQVLYRGKPKAENESAALNLYDQGVRMGSWGLLLHCLSASFYSALVQPHLVRKLGQCRAYLSGIAIFSLSLTGTLMTDSLVLVNTFCALSGAGYVALSTVPYSLIIFYHTSKQASGNNDRGIGEDMAILDSAYYLSQIIPSLFLGYVVELSGSSSAYMVVAALCGAAACYLCFFIKSPPKTVHQ